jgi:P-type Cu+ transporter
MLLALTILPGATDPVCGMKVDRAKALRLEHADGTQYFCSERCRDAFVGDPGRYRAHERPPAEPARAATPT